MIEKVCNTKLIPCAGNSINDKSFVFYTIAADSERHSYFPLNIVTGRFALFSDGDCVMATNIDRCVFRRQGPLGANFLGMGSALVFLLICMPTLCM